MDSPTNAKNELKRTLCIPKGFRNLLECLTIEVLKHQPSDINTFAANYFKQRLQARQENGYDECLLGSQIDGFYKFDKARQSEDEHQFTKVEAAVKIQSKYRGYATRKKLKNKVGKPAQKKSREEGQEEEKRNVSDQDWKATRIQSNDSENHESTLSQLESEVEANAATKIQASYRGYRVRKSKSSCQGAVIKIQSNYRGYKTRKNLRQNGTLIVPVNYVAPQSRSSKHPKTTATNQGGDCGRKSQEKGSINLIQDQAATKIQAQYRGYKTRKNMSKPAAGVLRRPHSASDAEILATTRIQAGFRGYRIRKQKRRNSLNSTKDRAATKIQSCYRGYKARKTLKQTGPHLSLLTVDSLVGDGVTRPYDSRFSFSLPEDVKFEGSLDDDSDSDIDKVVNKMQAYQESVKGMKEIRASEEDTAGEIEDVKENQV